MLSSNVSVPPTCQVLTARQNRCADTMSTGIVRLHGVGDVSIRGFSPPCLASKLTIPARVKLLDLPLQQLALRSHIITADLALNPRAGSTPSRKSKTLNSSKRGSTSAAAATPAGLDSALPSPPAGFILNEQGEVALMAPESNRLLNLFDEAVGRSLECVVRRTVVSSTGLQFFLLYPLDVPIIIYRISSSNGAQSSSSGLVEIDDAELQEVFPTASFALARRNFHLVLSGFVLTVRGAVCFNQDDVSSINVQYGMGIGGDLSEGVEIASFKSKSNHYVVYTPFDPLLFPAFKDPESGKILVAEDEELLDDPKVIGAIDEEQDYQRMVNEEEDMAQMAKDQIKRQN